MDLGWNRQPGATDTHRSLFYFYNQWHAGPIAEIHCFKMKKGGQSIALMIFSLGLIFSQQKEGSIHKQQSTYYKNRSSPPVEKVNVLTGLDILLDKKPHFIQTRTIGLVTNQTGIDKAGVPNYKRLMEMEDVDLKVIFSPEHGLFGEASDGEQVYYDSLGPELPEVISLYGSTRKPTPEMLSGINLIIYDIQDIGTRFYTFISTLGLVMEAAERRVNWPRTS